MNNILFIVGLPGSGKSHLAQKINQENDGKYKIIDDPRSFDQILPFVDQDLIITDPALCFPQNRELAIKKITEVNPNVKFDWIYFENDPETCLRNSESRNQELIQKGKAPRKVDSFIRNLHQFYTIPEGSNVLKVWTK